MKMWSCIQRITFSYTEDKVVLNFHGKRLFCLTENDWNLTLGCLRFLDLDLSPVLDSIFLLFVLLKKYTIFRFDSFFFPFNLFIITGVGIQIFAFNHKDIYHLNVFESDMRIDYKRYFAFYCVFLTHISPFYLLLTFSTKKFT